MVLFGGIAVMGGILGWRTMTHPDQASVCLINSPCRGCLKLSDCFEPKAAEFIRKQSRLSPKSDSGSVGKPGKRSLG